MAKTYLSSLELPPALVEEKFCLEQKRTCYNGIYPFKIFPDKELERIEFSPITIFYGGNGSGKTTLLNIIAEMAKVYRHSAFSGGAFFDSYISNCRLYGTSVPDGSQILTSDDIFDYLINIRYLNNGVDLRREELFEDYYERKNPNKQNVFTGMDNYDEWMETHAAKTTSQSKYVKARLSRNVDMFSNGESAMKFFVDHISENALYLLDEPENSLSIKLQQELTQYIYDSARYYGCQFIIATHSPVLLSIDDAVIYDLDSYPVETKDWTELENVRRYYDFFMEHSSEF